ncbi:MULTISPECIES: carbohydrate ABC transporter permease [unclassified Rhizobium]|uniref:carbohydrate ABC transporter permease n=1 Tax=unclassified Rhizobium TaxID=2613769 RepID=UPI0006FEB713|nr:MULTISPECIES: carbohydrate ABC transporter permease [unclassified Rhizobium]KQV37058.1 sugar ABC transporter permease [Rhizobium sp. Root1212]KRD28640.1 sugar ABC transporter permease [Rhizobium sp. Root268]
MSSRPLFSVGINFIVGWGAVLLLVFPIIWMLLTSFKTEIDAISPEASLIFQPTLDNYRAVLGRSNYWMFALNSVGISAAATFLALLIGFPAAYSMAFHPTERTKGTLLWLLSTKMMPPVGVLVPIYILFKDMSLIDTHLGLILLFLVANLPIVVWMLYSFFKDIPRDILEAARIDGAGLWEEFRFILLPLSGPAISSTALLSIILCWNEAFWSINLSTTKAATLAAFIATYSAPQGLFWAKLSAAAVLAVAPVLIMGWVGQRHLVRGLTFGAVK